MSHVFSTWYTRAFLPMALASLAACGSSHFSGGATSPPTSADPATTTPAPSTGDAMVTNLTWGWDCLGDEKTAGGDNQTIRGPGTHHIVLPSDADKVSLQLNANKCQPSTLSEDVVLAIDVSGSMGGPKGNDPANVKEKSCGRLEAVDMILTSMVNADAQFGLVTFSDPEQNVSSKMFTKGDDLLQDVLASSGEKNIFKVICDANGGTNYGAALQKASDLLQANGRQHSHRQVFFISDGKPDASSADADGVSIAQTLKASGVTIATVMLKGDDQVMQSKIASVDGAGQPLHAKVENASDLAAAVKKLSANSLLGQNFRYKRVGDAQWTSVNLLAQNSATIDITKADLQKGYLVVFEYWDQQGHHTVMQGQIAADAP